MHPTSARFTHIALPCADIDASIAWYERYTPLQLLDRRQDSDGFGAWLGDPGTADKPFVLVLVSSFVQQDAGHHATLTPFAHLGIELPTKAAVDEIAGRGRDDDCLHWEPQQLPPPIGYICALTDPDGNIVEFSFDQGVYAKAHEKWAT